MPVCFCDKFWAAAKMQRIVSLDPARSLPCGLLVSLLGGFRKLAVLSVEVEKTWGKILQARPGGGPRQKVQFAAALGTKGKTRGWIPRPQALGITGGELFIPFSSPKHLMSDTIQCTPEALTPPRAVSSSHRVRIASLHKTPPGPTQGFFYFRVLGFAMGSSTSSGFRASVLGFRG